MLLFLLKVYLKLIKKQRPRVTQQTANNKQQITNNKNAKTKKATNIFCSFYSFGLTIYNNFFS